VSLTLAGDGTLTGVDADASGLLALSRGVGSNVVQTVKTDVFSSTSATFEDVTGLTATITPSSATSKVLIIAQVAYGIGAGAGTVYGHFRLNGGNANAYVGDADGIRVQAVFGGSAESDQSSALLSGSIVYLDSPGSATAQTYAVQVRRGSVGTVQVNRSGGDINDTNRTRGASSITVIEVAA
jgi:hypothetical protein